MDDVTTLLPARHKLDVDAYYAMAEAGILPRGVRTELIDGEIIDMAPIGQDHAATVDWLNERLMLAGQGRVIIRVQNPVRFDQYNEPEPDFAILRRRDDFYRTGERAGPDDTLLLIEVADTSLRYDQTVKMRLYARAGIPEYWIVDLKARKLENYRDPGPEGYATRSTHGPADRLALVQDSTIVVPLDRLFG